MLRLLRRLRERIVFFCGGRGRWLLDWVLRNGQKDGRKEGRGGRKRCSSSNCGRHHCGQVRGVDSLLTIADFIVSLDQTGWLIVIRESRSFGGWMDGWMQYLVDGLVGREKREYIQIIIFFERRQHAFLDSLDVETEGRENVFKYIYIFIFVLSSRWACPLCVLLERKAQGG